MKKLFLISILIFSNYIIFGQSNSNSDTNPKHKLGLEITPKLGFGKINETENVPLNGFVNGADAIISTKFTNAFNIQTGIGYFEFEGNRNLNGNTTYLKNSYLQIPLKLKGELSFYEDQSKKQNVFLTAGFGIYANNLLSQKTETISTSNSESNLGWNFGTSIQLGMKFNLTDKFNLGIGYEAQNDFSKMKKNDIERKVENLNTIYFSLGFRL